MNRPNARNHEEKNRENAASSRQRETTRKDFWDKIADDVASGYGARSRDRNIFNSDQHPDDNRRGDEETGSGRP